MTASSHHPASLDVPVDVYSALAHEWDAIGTGPKARHAIEAWGGLCPALVDFKSPAELIATIGQMGDPARSCALLADLLVLAATDNLATRAVLQAVLPGLRSAAKRQWQPASTGPWGSLDEVHIDAVSMGWEAIHVHRGERYHRPAAVLVSDVEARLRQSRDRWCKQTSSTIGLATTPAETTQSGPDAAFSAERQATTIIADALHAGVLDAAQAAVTFAVGVVGYTISDAGRLVGMQHKNPYRAVHRARGALRAWTSDPSDVTTTGRLVTRQRLSSPQRGFSRPTRSGAGAVRAQPSGPTAIAESPEDPGMHPLLLTPVDAARQLGISRSKLYTLIKGGQIDSVRIGTARRIPYIELVDYVERLRHHDTGSEGTTNWPAESQIRLGPSTLRPAFAASRRDLELGRGGPTDHQLNAEHARPGAMNATPIRKEGT